LGHGGGSSAGGNKSTLPCAGVWGGPVGGTVSGLGRTVGMTNVIWFKEKTTTKFQIVYGYNYQIPEMLRFTDHVAGGICHHVAGGIFPPRGGWMFLYGFPHVAGGILSVVVHHVSLRGNKTHPNNRNNKLRSHFMTPQLPQSCPPHPTLS
jgi:hypothetical protein